MPAVTIRNLSGEAHRALKVRAAQHGRSTEAEMRDILETAARPEKRIQLGSLLVSIGRSAGPGPDTDLAFDTLRDKAPAEPPAFEFCSTQMCFRKRGRQSLPHKS